MRILKNGLIGLFLLLSCLMATNAFAQADKQGFDFRASIAVPLYRGASAKVEVGDTTISQSGGGLQAVGVGLDLQFIYRWKYFGLGVEQLFGGVFSTADYGSISMSINGNDANVSASIFKKGDGAFYGETFFVLKEYIPIGSTHLVTIAEGLGASYGAKLDHKRLYVTDTDAAFAAKFELGYTYFIMDTYGVGLNLSYTASLAISNGVSFSQTFTPSVVFNMIF